MAQTKTYQITINGVKESITAVDNLNKSLKAIDENLKAIEAKSVKVNASGGGSSGGGSKSSLSEEEKLVNQIAQTDAKRAAYSKEIYQSYMASKDALKETLADQNQLAASQRLQLDQYSNTMQGMKQHLADLKTMISTTDIGDSEGIQKMTAEANELTNKLKEMEEAYGQFGRNVGNYKSATDGLQKINIEVGGVTREFTSARDALKTLSNELKTMAINGEQGTDKFKDLQNAVAKLSSEMKDATVSSQAMDNLLDTLKSFGSIGQITQGFSALFGFDDSEIEKSIQKLVALQNAMQGLESIQQQIKSGEGIGGWIKEANAALDRFVDKLLGANTAQKTLTETTNAATVAQNAQTKATNAATVAQNGLAKATKATAVATKSLKAGFASLAIVAVITAVSTLITYWDDIKKEFTETVPILKNLGKWFNQLRTILSGVGTVIANMVLQPLNTLGKVVMSLIKGNFAEIPNIIMEGLGKSFHIITNYQKGKNREIQRQQDQANKEFREKQKKALDDQEADAEAMYGRDTKRTQEYLKKKIALIKGNSEEEIQERKELERRLWSEQRQAREENTKKSQAAAKQNAKQEANIEQTLQKNKLDAMKDGFNKKLLELEIEHLEMVRKLKENGMSEARAEEEARKVTNNKKKQLYEEEAKQQREALDKLQSQEGKALDNRTKIAVDAIKNEIDALQSQFTSLNSLGIVDSDDVKRVTQGLSEVQKKMFTLYNLYRKLQELGQTNALRNQRKDEIVQKMLGISPEEFAKDAEKYTKAFEQQFEKELFLVNKTGAGFIDNLDDALKESFADIERNRKEILDVIRQYIEQRKALLRDAYANEANEAEEAEKKRYDAEKERLSKELIDKTKLYSSQIEKGEDKEARETYELLENLRQQDETNERLHQITIENIRKEYANKNKELDKQTLDETSNAYQTYYRRIENTVRQALSKTNISQDTSRKKLKEYKNALVTNLKEIENAMKQANSDLKGGLITEEQYQSTMATLTNLKNDATDKLNGIGFELKQGLANFMQSAQQYIQEGFNAFSTIMNAIWSAQDAQFDKEQEALDKENQMLDQKLSEQRSILEEHTSNVESIESELATARGSRRQNLIDQLNAEMAAKKEARKQEKKLEREKEKQEKKQEELDKKRKIAEYNRQILQAVVNGSMAVTYAAMNTWPIPAIPMMALAAATTAAQIAIMKANKPYANGGQLDGGVAVGNRHRDGGIKVLGGHAEIEGGEFITNRYTTAKNVDLLSYINSKKKKIDVSDLLEFYGGKSVKKSISSVSSFKYENGGLIPTMTNDYNVDDRLLAAFESYSNRPVVVSVVDINKRQNAVKNVRVLAGLDA